MEKGIKIITNNSRETQSIAKELGKLFLNLINTRFVYLSGRSVILAFEGDLGTGKTTFIQGLAKGFGIKEKILSPSFILIRGFKIPKKPGYFYHLDCYRLDNYKDLRPLNLKNIFKGNNIAAIEWADKVKRILPKNYIKIKLKWLDKNKREITIIKYKN